MKRFLWACFVVLGVTTFGEVGCQGPTLPAKTKKTRTLPSSARPANTAELSADEVNRGAKLCLAKCARCHPLYDPSAYSDVEWQQWMTRMSKKARLKTGQEELLSRYLQAFRLPQ
jgi:hypothetical protein